MLRMKRKVEERECWQCEIAREREREREKVGKRRERK